MTGIAPQHAGKSILEIIWEDLDAVYDQLVSEGAPDLVGLSASEADAALVSYGELRGQAQGLAYAIAVIQNPYDVDVPAVKKQARQRYEDASNEE